MRRLSHLLFLQRTLQRAGGLASRFRVDLTDSEMDKTGAAALLGIILNALGILDANLKTDSSGYRRGTDEFNRRKFDVTLPTLLK